MKTLPVKSLSILLTLGLSCSASLALAQYVWIDGKGVKQYSDMPPPSGIVRSKILKEPDTTVQVSPAAAPTPGDTGEKTTDAANATNAPMTIAERNADFQKRKMEQAEKDRKTADTAKQATDKAANCDKARTYGRSLDDGTRLVTSDKNGERSFMTDEQRAVEIRNNQRMVNECK